MRCLQYIAAFVIFHSVCGLWEEERQLRSSLGLLQDTIEFKGKPSCQPSTAVNINISLSLLKTLQMDEKNEILETSVWVRLAWCDQRLRWDPAAFGGIKEIKLNPSQLWVPDIYLLNNAAGTFSLHEAMAKVLVSHTGIVVWVNPAIYKSACAMDVTYFPFDDQECYLKYGSVTYNSKAMMLKLISVHVDTSRYVKHGEWVLMKTQGASFLRIHGTSKCSEVIYSLVFRRRTLYYMMNFILPCVLISVLTLLVFLLPPESGERVSYGITVILSFTILILMLYEKMPVTSAAIPLIAVYYACTTFEVSIALALCCWSLRFYHHDPPTDELPRWVKRVVLDWCARLVSLKESSDQVRQELILHSWEEAANVKTRAISRNLSVLIESIHRKEEESAKREEWRIVATIVNRVFLWAFVITAVLTFFIVFLGCPRVRALEF